MNPPDPAPDRSLRLRLARPMLVIAPVFLAAAHLPWLHSPMRDAWSLLYEGITTSGSRGGLVYVVWAISFAMLFFVMIPPWPWCIRALRANAPLRWLCRVLAAVWLFWNSYQLATYDRISRVGRGLSGGSWCLILSGYTNALGLWLLPGRKPAAPFIPSGADPEPSAPTYDESRSR